MNDFSNADFGIIALIYLIFFINQITGNDIVVKLKLPEIIFRPISLIIVLPTLLDNSIVSLSRHAVPPFL